MKKKFIPTVEVLHDDSGIALPEHLHLFFEVNFETGELWWKQREVKYFTTRQYCNIWNTKHAGKRAFTAHDDHGYLLGSLFGRRYKAHRIIWALKHGVWPDNIDHSNGIKDDNREVNLRSVSATENMRNQKLHSTNTSGTVGVCWDKRRSKWQARIVRGGRFKHLGYFKNKKDAVGARAEADIKYGFHENHGRD